MSRRGDLISQHEVLVYFALRDRGGWMTNFEVARAAGSIVSPRTARHHTKAMTDRGVVENRPLFPGHVFRWSPEARRVDGDYVRRLEEAALLMGVESPIK